jgi:hypothetical protein
MQYLNPVGLGPSSKDVLNVPQRAQTISFHEPFLNYYPPTSFYSVLFKET